MVDPFLLVQTLFYNNKWAASFGTNFGGLSITVDARANIRPHQNQ